MNPIEIEEAVSQLADLPFAPDDFPYAFLAAFGMKETTLKRLRNGQTNASDVQGGILQRNNIHIAVCPEGKVTPTLAELRQSPRTTSAKAKFTLATDGLVLEAEELASGEHIACAYTDIARNFGFFLPLAGISTISEIKNNPFDVKATGRLNKLYVQLLKDNPDWATETKRSALNQFITRLIFCFFAEDTSIFLPKQFTRALEQMSDGQSGNTHEVLAELFRAMDTKPEDRARDKTCSWADVFPYVNGGMFAGSNECPRFSRFARSYLLAIGNLEWDKINPDIFGSMIQAVADEGERGSIGMHYTSVPNILKVLRPLFLDDLREQLEAAGDNVRRLRNLRKRIANIKVFDPACGSGNFLVIAYKEMRAIEHEIVLRTKDEAKSWIKLDNFYGLEIKNFSVEIARLALLIAEFQCDVRFISQQEARSMVLPLHRTGQIHVGNALREDWLKFYSVTAPPVEHDLAGPTGRLALGDGGIEDRTTPEFYICGNPPYKGSQSQTEEQKEDLRLAFNGSDLSVGSADYVFGWFTKAAHFVRETQAAFAFVTTNSIHQGRQVARFWPHILGADLEIFFAEPSFKWTNLASNKAVVTVSVIGIRGKATGLKRLFDSGLERLVRAIGPYLVPDTDIVVEERRAPLSKLGAMSFGSMPNDGGALLLDFNEAEIAMREGGVERDFIRPVSGTEEFINGAERRCIWVTKETYPRAAKNSFLASRFQAVEAKRKASTRETTAKLASVPYRFGEVRQRGDETVIIVSKTSSEARPYLPVDLLPKGHIITEAFGIFDGPLWSLALIASRLHLVWVATVCGKMKTDFRYSNTLGWNTFPVPALTETNRRDLTLSAEGILLARGEHFPATIAALYDAEEMPEDLRRAHDANDEMIERIYIGRRFRNDTERLGKLFELYTQMTAAEPQTKKKAKSAA